MNDRTVRGQRICDAFRKLPHARLSARVEARLSKKKAEKLKVLDTMIHNALVILEAYQLLEFCDHGMIGTIRDLHSDLLWLREQEK